MRRRVALLLAALSVAALPLTGRAQTPPAMAPAEPSAAQPAPATVSAPKPAAGKVTITPYGFVLAQAFWSNGPFAVRDFPGQVLANHDGGAFIMEARGSRFGFKIALPDDPWTAARLTGVLEADFKGGYFATNSASSYNAIPRLRLAYMQAQWGTGDTKLTLLAGQDWGLIAPLFATTVAWGYDPIFWQAGNLWRRSQQIKAALDLGAGGVGVSVQAAMLSPADAGMATSTPAVFNGAVDYGEGNRARVPNLEGRVALWAKMGTRKIFELGASGHWDKRRFSPAGAANLYSVDTTGEIIAADGQFNLPFLTLQGEAFMNSGAGDTPFALTSAVTAIGAGTAAAPVAITPLRSRGGWGQAVLKFGGIAIPVGYGMEQIIYTNNAAGAPDLASIGVGAGTRTRNAQFHTGIIFGANNPWKYSFEWTHTTSGYALAAFGSQSVKADMFALATKLDF